MYRHFFGSKSVIIEYLILNLLFKATFFTLTKLLIHYLNHVVSWWYGMSLIFRSQRNLDGYNPCIQLNSFSKRVKCKYVYSYLVLFLICILNFLLNHLIKSSKDYFLVLRIHVYFNIFKCWNSKLSTPIITINIVDEHVLSKTVLNCL